METPLVCSGFLGGSGGLGKQANYGDSWAYYMGYRGSLIPSRGWGLRVKGLRAWGLGIEGLRVWGCRLGIAPPRKSKGCINLSDK